MSHDEAWNGDEVIILSQINSWAKVKKWVQSSVDELPSVYKANIFT